MFFWGQNLVKIQLEKYDFKLLYKEKKIMIKVTQIHQNLQKKNPNRHIFMIISST
jgi:division protein CdvB (Snf7/Vps24/ESCRT-III family)